MGKLSDLNLHGRPDNIRNERKSQLEKSPHRSLYLRQTVQKSHKTISVRAGFLFPWVLDTRSHLSGSWISAHVEDIRRSR